MWQAQLWSIPNTTIYHITVSSLFIFWNRWGVTSKNGSPIGKWEMVEMCSVTFQVVSMGSFLLILFELVHYDGSVPRETNIC